MKKTTSLLMTLSLSASLILGACGAKATPATPGTPTQTPTTAEALKVTYIVGGNLGDKSFNDSAWEGLNRAKTDFGVEINAVELAGDPSKQEPTLRDVSEQGVDIIMVASGGLTEAVAKIAPEFPDVKYVVFDIGPDYKITSDNVYGLTFKQNEADFLAGALGAKLSKTGVLGFVGGQENPIINDFLVGYINGAQKANPDVKIAVSFVGNWTDSAKGKELSFAQVLLGADVLHGVAGGAGLGVIDAALEKGLWAIGVDADQSSQFKDSDPSKSAIIVSSALKNVGQALYTVIENNKADTVKWGEAESMGIKEGVVGLAKNDVYEKNVPADVKTWINELETKVKSGEIVVPSSFTMTNDAFITLKNSVKP